MAPNAARLITSIIDAVCANELSAADVRDLDASLESFPALLDRTMAGLSDAETAAVDRAMQAGARQLSTLGTRLACIVRSGDAGAASVPDRFMLACDLSRSLFTFTVKHAMCESIQSLFSCATLPLECGLALMAKLNASASDTAAVRVETTMLQAQAWLLLMLIQQATRGGTGVQRFVAHLAAPEPLLEWLSAAVNRVLAMHGTSLGRGPYLDLQSRLVVIASTVCVYTIYTPHATAIERSPALQRSLVQLLLPMLQAAAVAMQLPADKRPANLEWPTILMVARLLVAVELTGALKEELALIGGSHVSSSAQRALRSAAQLFAAAPDRCLDELTPETLTSLWTGLTLLLGVLCAIIDEACQQQQGQGSAAVPASQRKQMVQQVLQVLPQLPTGLRLAAEHKGGLATGVIAEPLLTQCSAILAFIDPSLPAPGDPEAAPTWAYTVSSLAEVSVCCAASSALLRALPHMAALAALADQRQQGAGERAGIAANVHFIGKCAAAMDEYSCSLGQRGSWIAADSAAAVEALWQLHTMLCRCFHTSAAGTLTFPDGMEESLVICMSLCLHSVVCISTTMRMIDTTSGAEAPSRHLLAMSVAQAEAVLVAASCPKLAIDVLLAKALLSQASDNGPAALASSPSVRQTLERLSEMQAVADEGATASLQNRLLTPPLRRGPQPGDALELALAAATRSCAYLRCANLAGEGGPAARQGAGSQRCSKCKVAWYCGTACSHADWRAGHRRMCGALGAARAAEVERRREEVDV